MFVPIIIGALGTMLKRLEYSLYEFGFSKKETKNLIQSVHIRSISGTIKIRKTFLRFAVWRLWKVYYECYIRSFVGRMDIFVVFRTKETILVIVLWFSPLFTYLFILLGLNKFWDSSSSIGANVLLWVLDALLRRPDEYVRRMHYKRIIFDYFDKDF